MEVTTPLNAQMMFTKTRVFDGNASTFTQTRVFYNTVAVENSIKKKKIGKIFPEIFIVLMNSIFFMSCFEFPGIWAEIYDVLPLSGLVCMKLLVKYIFISLSSIK